MNVMNEKQMNAYRLNEYEWYAAHDAEEAIAKAIETTGCARDEVIDECYFTGQPESRDTLIWIDEERTASTTAGALVDEMTEPGFVFGIDA